MSRLSRRCELLKHQPLAIRRYRLGLFEHNLRTEDHFLGSRVVNAPGVQLLRARRAVLSARDPRERSSEMNREGLV